MEVGAGTFHTATFLRAVGPEPWRAAYVQPSRRPTDGRYGDNPFRLQHYYQFQVVIKPSPLPILDLYLESLARSRPRSARARRALRRGQLGVADARAPGASGWEVWLNGMEITQFTYFQQVGGLDCRPVTGEITYGLERLAMYLQGVESIYRHRLDRGRRRARHLRRRVPSERSRAVGLQLRACGRDGAAAGTSTSTRAPARGCSRRGCRCPPTSRCSRPRTLSTCSMRGARSRSPSGSATSCACARSRARVAKAYLREPRGARLPAAEGTRAGGGR